MTSAVMGDNFFTVFAFCFWKFKQRNEPENSFADFHDAFRSENASA